MPVYIDVVGRKPQPFPFSFPAVYLLLKCHGKTSVDGKCYSVIGPELVGDGEVDGAVDQLIKDLEECRQKAKKDLSRQKSQAASSRSRSASTSRGRERNAS